MVPRGGRGPWAPAKRSLGRAVRNRARLRVGVGRYPPGDRGLDPPVPGRSTASPSAAAAAEWVVESAHAGRGPQRSSRLRDEDLCVCAPTQRRPSSPDHTGRRAPAEGRRSPHMEVPRAPLSAASATTARSTGPRVEPTAVTLRADFLEGQSKTRRHGPAAEIAAVFPLAAHSTIAPHSRA